MLGGREEDADVDASIHTHFHTCFVVQQDIRAHLLREIVGCEHQHALGLTSFLEGALAAARAGAAARGVEAAPHTSCPNPRHQPCSCGCTINLFAYPAPLTLSECVNTVRVCNTRPPRPIVHIIQLPATCTFPTVRNHAQGILVLAHGHGCYLCFDYLRNQVGHTQLQHTCTSRSTNKNSVPAQVCKPLFVPLPPAPRTLTWPQV